MLSIFWMKWSRNRFECNAHELAHWHGAGFSRVYNLQDDKLLLFTEQLKLKIGEQGNSTG